ncbi:MAG: barstar family protein [Hydrogenoanaerobacterium sp.]
MKKSDKKIIVLDLTDCKSVQELQERIKEDFGFPDFYGKNWDAFWDLLWSDCDADRVEIIGEHTLPDEFNASLKKLHEILQFNSDEHANYDWEPFDYEIID